MFNYINIIRMDLTRIKDVYPGFLKLLGDRGYSKSTIDKYRWIINRLLSEGSDSSILTLEDYFCNLKQHLSKGSVPEVRTYLGALSYYVEHGSFHRDQSFRSGFMSHSSYDCLNPYYRCLVDHSQSVLSAKYARSTVSSVKSASSVFCLYLMNHGCCSFDDVKSQTPVLEYFNDGGSLLHCSAHSYSLSLFLSSCVAICPACTRILCFLPKVRDWRKNYDCLTADEKQKIKDVLKGDALTLREKAIGTTLYYTGLRSSDVAGLCLDDIDLGRMLIAVRSQRKTGEPLTLPLQALVCDSICEYVENERPETEDDHIFITEFPPYKGMASGSMNNIVGKIMDKAAVRMDSGLRGTHIFRHALASDLIGADVPRQYVSRLLGHTSLSSLDSYIDADVEHLRQCGLDISPFHSGTPDQAILPPYKSGASEILGNMTSALAGTGQLSSSVHRSLRHLDDFCLSLFSGKPLSQEILDAWSHPLQGESAKSYGKRMECADVLDRYLRSISMHVERKDSPAPSSRQHYQSEFASPCRQLFADYVAYRRASLRWSKAYGYALKGFDAACICSMEKGLLCQKAIDLWCRQRDTESLASCGKRTAFLSGLCDYTNRLYGTSLVPPRITTRSCAQPVPHAFTMHELKNLFIACDSIERKHKSKATELRTLVVPAVFRLMYSSGLRTNEVRMLDCGDVDLKRGVIDISHTKGLNEHMVALHGSMTAYLMDYDRKMAALMPERKCFFPNADDRYYSSSWIDWNFERMWYSYNGGHAVPYDLRHNYAIENINSWPADRDLFDSNLVYLSRSMGHSDIDETMYYYAFTPQAAKIIDEHKSGTFRDIIGNDGASNIGQP